MLDRAILDFELERTSLHNKLKASQNLIKDTSEAGDVLIEDLNSIKNHVKNISINWDRVKVNIFITKTYCIIFISSLFSFPYVSFCKGPTFF